MVAQLKEGEGTTAGKVDSSQERRISFSNNDEVFETYVNIENETPIESVNTVDEHSYSDEFDNTDESHDTDDELETLQFDEDEAIAMLSSRNYKLRMSWGINSKSLLPQTVILDTGAGPNLVDYGRLPEKWKKKIKKVKRVSMTSASKDKMNLVGVIPIVIRLGDLKVRVWFGVIEELAVPVLLGTSFADRFIQGIFPQERKVVPNDSGPVAILSTLVKDPETNLLVEQDPLLCVKDQSDDKREIRFRVAKKRTIPPMSEAPVTVTTNAGGLMMLSPHPNLFKSRTALTAQGIMEVVPHTPFKVLVANLSNKPVDIPKHTIIAVGSDLPEKIVELTPSRTIDKKTSAGETVNAIPHYKEKENQETKFARHRNVDKSDEKRLEEDWRDEINFNDKKYAEFKEPFLDMMSNFSDMWDGRLGTITAAKHRIDLDPVDSRPIHSAPYRAGPKAREFEKQEIQKMLAMNVIEPAQSEWAAPIVFAPKKDGALRFCVDYRRLNAITVRDSYPIPRMDECMDSLGTAKTFSTLDANSGYWQVEIDPKDRDKTAFTSHHGLYRFIRMPFGLKNAPATFQRAIDVILSSVKWQFALVYLDDIVIFSPKPEEHIEHVKKVLMLLQDAGVTIKLRKCFFFTDNIDYLGHVIRPGTLEIAPKATEAIKNLKPPKNVTELRSFLGLCNVFRRFVPNFSRIAAPLNKKLKKGEPQHFDHLTDEELSAMKDLQDKLITPPVLALPRPNGRITIDTDACAYQVGCVLLQEQEDQTVKPIGYWSRSLTDAERRYDTTQRECLAVVWAILLLRPYLEGTRFTIRTDHSALKWLLNLADSSGRLARWRLRLTEFEFDIVHRAGIKHQAADALSRLETTSTDETELRDEIPTLTEDDKPPTTVLACFDCDELDLNDETCVCTTTDTDENDSDGLPSMITDEEFIKQQAEDEYCKEAAKSVGLPGSAFSIDKHGFLVRIAPLDGAVQKVVPASLKDRILKLGHFPPLSGHPGQRRMYDTMRRSLYWQHMANDINNTVERCPSCLKHRPHPVHQRHLKLFPAKGPLEYIAIDILGPLPRTKTGRQYVVVITDRYSKLTRAVPTAKITAPVVAAVVLEHWVIPYGIPNHILSDNGSQFVSKFFSALCAFLGAKLTTTTAYHPQTNGQTERYNKTIITRLRHYVNDHQTDWDLFVQPLTYAYNSQVHRSTGESPFGLVLSRLPPSPLVSTSSAIEGISGNTVPARLLKTQVLDRLKAMCAKVDKSASLAQARYKRYFDQKVRHTPSYQQGQMVYVDLPDPRLSTTGKKSSESEKLAKRKRYKLMFKKTGPFKIVATDSHTVTIDEDGLHNTVSIDRISPAPTDESTTAEQITEPAHRPTTNQHSDVTDDNTSSPPENVTQGQRTNEESSAPGPEFSDNPAEPEQYAVEKIIGHKGNRRNRRYVVRWYGYSSDFDTVEPPSNIPQHFITRYWRRQQKR